MDKLNPKTKEEFTAFKDAICKKILFYKKSDHFSYFVEELFRDLSAGRKYNDVFIVSCQIILWMCLCKYK